MFIDSHCHLDFSEFDADRAEVISRAKTAGVNRFIVPGVAQQYWQRQLALAAKFPECQLAFGVHPWFLNDCNCDFNWQSLDELASYAEREDCIAIGECGVDGVKPDIDLQLKVFEAQIELANQVGKPLIVHHRRSHHHIQAAFKRAKPENGGIIHAFSGSLVEAKKYLALGFKLGCGGVITYDRAERTRTVFQQLGLAHLVLETDSPSMPLHGFQGQRNEPMRIVDVVETLAELLNTSAEEIGHVTSDNVAQLFSKANKE